MASVEEPGVFTAVGVGDDGPAGVLGDGGGPPPGRDVQEIATSTTASSVPETVRERRADAEARRGLMGSEPV